MHFYNRLNVFFGEAQGFPILDAQRARSAFRGHTVPSAGTQCLSRLRRTHSVFSRLRRAHSAFRAYGGHTVPSAPTAGTQCLPRLRRSLRKQTARSLLSAPYLEALWKQAKITIPPHAKNRRIKHRRTQS